MTEENIEEQEKAQGQEYDRYTLDQLFKNINSWAAVNALKADCLANPALNRKHPRVPDCAEAHQFWVMIEDGEANVKHDEAHSALAQMRVPRC